MSKNRKGQARAARLEALLRVGDLRGAQHEARRLLADPGTGGTDRDAAAAALRRASPERAAAIAAGVGFAFFLAVALIGILSRR